MLHFKTISDMHKANGFAPPEHPLVSLFQCTLECKMENAEFSTDFYIIGFKKLKGGIIKYGRTQYDHQSGSMIFIKPRQIIQFKDLQLEDDGFIIYIHEDFFNGSALHQDIKKYGFFDYEINEALHLSAQEEKTMWELYHQMEAEYYNNEDEYSREIILSHIDAILKYAQRYYKRQFLHRTIQSGVTVSKFQHALSEHFASNQYQEEGLPSVSTMASKLHISPRYLSDLLKAETGKTAMELIHLHLIGEAKNLLKGADQTVSEIAYSLGFENLPYFSRLFKKEVGLSPQQYKKQYA
jgi:AraC family transcriptional activator of pobA